MVALTTTCTDTLCARPGTSDREACRTAWLDETTDDAAERRSLIGVLWTVERDGQRVMLCGCACHERNN